MSLAGSRARLIGLTKELVVKWQDAKEGWKDAKSLEFEKKFVDALLTQMEKSDGIAEKLDAIIKKARKDCE